VRRRKRPSERTLRWTAQVFEFMAVRLGYSTEQVNEAVRIWNVQIRAGKPRRDVTQIDMLKELERIIEVGWGEKCK